MAKTPIYVDVPDPYDDGELRQRLAAIESRVSALESVPEPPEPEPPLPPPVPPAPLPSGSANEHFETVAAMDSVVASFSLRDVSQWSERRNGDRTTVDYSADLDACRFILPPRENEGGGFMFRWTDYTWEVGDKLVVQHDFMLNDAMFGSDVGQKFTNLCRGDRITYELNPEWIRHNPCPFGLRVYGGKLEGRQERDQLSSDVADPTRTYFGRGSGYDKNPGPDSTYPYGGLREHHETFRADPNEWARVTYELARVTEGTRVKMWLATESTDPALVVASPIDPTLGFLVTTTEPITGFYAECDSSQEKVYDVDQPERWIAFRNLVAITNVSGEQVLGGKPIR